MSKKKSLAILMALSVIFLPSFLFGASINTSNTTAVLEAVRLAFVAICGVVTTILVIYTGFKLYQGQTLPELTKLLWMIAAFGSAAAIGSFVDDFMK